MSSPASLLVLLLLFAGPIASRLIEQNIEVYFLALGILSTTLAGALDLRSAARAGIQPIPITITVIAAGIVFALMRRYLDRAFEWLLLKFPHRVVTGVVVFVLAVLSSFGTAIIGALLLVEAVEMLRLEARAGIQVTVAGCFAIGICSSLTPLGGPLSTLAAGALQLPFWGLFELLGVYFVPGTAACAVLAGILTRGELQPRPRIVRHIRETWRDALIQGAKVFGFVAGLTLIGEAFAPLAGLYVGMMGDRALFWANSISAVLDNSTLVALELHGMNPDRSRAAILALVLSGGMLIPGNIPNIIAAGSMRIGSGEWARVGVPIGAALMCIYFALLFVVW